MKLLARLWSFVMTLLQKEPVPAPIVVPEIQPTPVPPPAPVEPPKPKPDTRYPLYEAAIAALGKDISKTQNELGCAESVSYLLNKVYGDFPAGVLSTITLRDKLRAHKKFRGTLDYAPGVIVMSATNGSNVGHTGIFGKGDKIMSNTSATSRWTQNYTLASWVKYFRTQKGLRVEFYERIPD